MPAKGSKKESKERSDTVEVTRTYTYRLTGISKAKRRKLNKLFAGMCLWYNYFVSLCKENSRQYRAWKEDPDNHDKPKTPSYFAWCNLITEQEKEGGVPNKEGDLISTKHLPRFAKCNAAKRVNLALQEFLSGKRDKAGRKRGFPRYRPFHKMQSFELASVHAPLTRVSGNKWVFTVPKLKVRLTFIDRQKILASYGDRATGKFKGVVRVVRHPLGSGYDLQITKTERVKKPAIDYRDPVGVDVGVKYLATTCNGTHYSKIEKSSKVKALQRKLSKAKKGSKSREKKRTSLAKEKSRERNGREDALHRASSDIIKNQSANVATEKLTLANMTRSAKGTADNPGKNVKAKSGLNRELLNNGLGKFATMLSYKAKRAGGEYIEVPAAYTSQTCSKCGHVDKENRKSQAVFACVKCGFRMNADHNAAINIRVKGFPESFGRANDLPVRGPIPLIKIGGYELPLLPFSDEKGCVSNSTAQNTLCNSYGNHCEDSVKQGGYPCV